MLHVDKSKTCLLILMLLDTLQIFYNFGLLCFFKCFSPFDFMVLHFLIFFLFLWTLFLDLLIILYLTIVYFVLQNLQRFLVSRITLSLGNLILFHSYTHYIKFNLNVFKFSLGSHFETIRLMTESKNKKLQQPEGNKKKCLNW